MSTWARLGAIAGVLGALLGCDQVRGPLGTDLPTASLNRVDLLESPNVNQMLGYGCGELGFGATTCAVAGLDVPRKADLLFRFDLVFDVDNPTAVPIPLVETLLGFTAFETANLGSVCVSYCDPEDEDCTAGINVEGACDPGSAKGVKGPEDLIPSVEELVTIASDLEDGVDPADWRVIEPDSGIETHVQFDLGIDPMLELASSLLDQSVSEFLDGKRISMEVPYTVEGTLFFDVPDVNRYAIGFGPLADTWDLDDGPGR
jgi:hypothetical protein